MNCQLMAEEYFGLSYYCRITVIFPSYNGPQNMDSFELGGLNNMFQFWESMTKGVLV